MSHSNSAELYWSSQLPRVLTLGLSIPEVRAIFHNEHYPDESRAEAMVLALSDSALSLPSLNWAERETCEVYTNLYRPASTIGNAKALEIRKVALACIMCVRSYIESDDVDGLQLRLPLLFASTSLLTKEVVQLGQISLWELGRAAQSPSSRYLCHVTQLLYHFWLSSHIGATVIGFKPEDGGTSESFWKDMHHPPDLLQSWRYALHGTLKGGSYMCEAATYLSTMFGLE